MHSSEHEAPHTFSGSAARQISDLVKDLIAPKPWIYWLDLLATFCVAQLGLFVYLRAPLWSALFFAGFLVASLAYLRGVVFAHELIHVRAGTFRGLRIMWNMLFGIPAMFPLFLYEDHKIHHSNQFYGTPEDAEYYAFARGPLFEIFIYLIRIFVVPPLVVGRFMILAPLAWIVPRLRTWVWSLTSPNVALNVKYRREVPADPRVLAIWKLQEFACVVYGAVFLSLMATGVLPWTILLRLYCMFVFISGINYLRVLGGHRFLSDGRPSSHIDQLLDSYTITSWPFFGELWAPIAMRYHALHHLIPSLPYHNMHIAHRRLVTHLPPDSPYRSTIRSSLWEALGEVVASSRTSRAAPNER
jgi:fatty acid desaturase